MVMIDSDQNRKAIIARVFAHAASGYGHITHFPPLGRRIVELSQIPAGARILDVATGRGAILFPAAEKVGPSGEVIGIDISAGMVQETGAEIMRRGLKNVRICQMDAEALDFPDSSFDYVLCGFALQFFPHLDQALAECRRVLKQQGRIAVSTWGADDTRWSWYKDLRVAYQANVKLQSQSFERLEVLEDIFRGAGFSHVTVLVEPFDWVCARPEEWWSAQWSMSSRAGLEKLEPLALEEFKAEVFHHMEALKQPDGFHELLLAQFTLAQKP
jgi:ubiquinone/menaquinone biosynthesis C-methylase UbiE